jgi:hypothetical protein
MSPDLRHKLIVGSIAVLIGLIALVVARLINRRKVKLMNALAGELGLHVSGGDKTYPKSRVFGWMTNPIVVTGTCNRHFVKFQHTQVGRSTYHGFNMATSAAYDFHVYIQNAGFFSNIAGMIGLKSIQTGDSFFDSKIAVRSNDPVLASAIFTTPEIKRILLETWNKEKPAFRVEITRRTIGYKCRGGLTTRRRVRHMVAMIRTAAALADALDAANSVLKKK